MWAVCSLVYFSAALSVRPANILNVSKSLEITPPTPDHMLGQLAVDTGLSVHSFRTASNCTQEQLKANEPYMLARSLAYAGNEFFPSHHEVDPDCQYAQAMHRPLHLPPFNLLHTEEIAHWAVIYYNGPEKDVTVSEVCLDACDVPDTFAYQDELVFSLVSVFDHVPISVCVHNVSQQDFQAADYSMLSERVNCSEMFAAEKQAFGFMGSGFSLYDNNCKTYIQKVVALLSHDTNNLATGSNIQTGHEVLVNSGQTLRGFPVPLSSIFQRTPR
eukprot:c21161_g1_i1.p1 GENE.c21161_g1_i1~~c21161_g1_i1.p1  ORF type:complete len:273 (-),score=35.29 c21161_g1_i1:19-837(-)